MTQAVIISPEKTRDPALRPGRIVAEMHGTNSSNRAPAGSSETRLLEDGTVFSLQDAFQAAPVNLAGEREYRPLRKKMKRKATGQEDNFVPSYYQPAEEVLSLSEWEIKNLRRAKRIELSGHCAIAPVSNFEQMGLPLNLCRALNEKGIVAPTPIQMQGLPLIMSGRDVIALAPTGSGKTLCYVIPLCMKIAQMTSGSATAVQALPQDSFAATNTPCPIALIVCPSRELADQIRKETAMLFHIVFGGTSTSEAERLTEGRQCLAFDPSTDVQWVPRVIGIWGGISIQEQIVALLHHSKQTLAMCVVCTAGRLLDLVDRRAISLHGVQYLVLDEVDRMLDVGTEPQLRAIVGLAGRRGRQTLLFSATLPLSLQRLARSAVLNPVSIAVGMGSERTGLTAPNIQQHVWFMRTSEKKARLLEALRETSTPPVLVFCNSTRTVDFVCNILRREQFHAAPLHGDKPQEYRSRVMEAFKKGEVDVLVATDVASRGLDVSDVVHVILYDTPNSIEDYIHRCGRTGRAQKTGRATTFLTLECTIAAELKDVLKQSGQRVPLELENTKKFGGT